MNLKGKVAIITGGAGGLGQAITKELIECGAKVIITDVNEEALIHAKKQYELDGKVIHTSLMNVLDKKNVNRMIGDIYETHGSIDILVNNAGGSLYTPKNLEEIEEEHWNLVLNVNLRGTFFCSQAVVPFMKKQRKGSIINISSIGGRSASPVTGVAYAAAKGGIISFSRRLAYEVGKDGIRVNTIAPGLVISGKRMQGMWDAMSHEEQQSVTNSIPLRRFGEAHEQAKVIAFLASDESAYMNGAVLDVNGGRFMP